MFRVDREGDFENAFASAKRARVQAVLQISSPLFAANRQALVDMATRVRLPIACETREFVVLGCLLSYGPSFDEMFRRVATYVDKSVKGAKAGELPIEQPTAVPPSILVRADEIIQ